MKKPNKIKKVKAVVACSGECDIKCKKPKWKCIECGSIFCQVCADESGGECHFCEPPRLEKI